MLVHAFVTDEHLVERGLSNYWGYDSLGLRFAGDAIDEVDAAGHPVRDDTLLLVLNAYREPLDFVLPAHKAGLRWEVVLDTRAADGRVKHRPLKAGETWQLEPRSLALLRLRRRELRRC